MERRLKLPFTFALALGLYFVGGMFSIVKLNAALKRPCKRSAEAAKETKSLIGANVGRDKRGTALVDQAASTM